MEKVQFGSKVMVLDRKLLATSAVMQAHQLAVLPENLSLEDAASLSVAFPAVIYSLLYTANLQKEQSILIHSACNNLGLAALQLSRMIGAKVWRSL